MLKFIKEIDMNITITVSITLLIIGLIRWVWNFYIYDVFSFKNYRRRKLIGKSQQIVEQIYAPRIYTIAYTSGLDICYYENRVRVNYEHNKCVSISKYSEKEEKEIRNKKYPISIIIG